MTAPFLPPRSVEDATVDLIEAAASLRRARADADRVSAALDARWAANRARRAGWGRPSGGPTPSNGGYQNPD